jgi:CrcB protein
VLKLVATICIGASLGAMLRWWLGLELGSIGSSVPAGTLASNLIGGYVVGLAVAAFAMLPDVAPEWRLFVITGFCGGLTTFSAFSAEVVALLQDERWLAACATAASHLGGSILMTLAGIGTVALVRTWS